MSKQDVGTSGYAEQEKSQASDSFKRACFNIGIGRELYTAPFIWVSKGNVDIQKRDGKLVCFERFAVSGISYNDHKEISHLEIVNEKGKVVYPWDLKKTGMDVRKNADSAPAAVKADTGKKDWENGQGKTVRNGEGQESSTGIERKDETKKQMGKTEVTVEQIAVCTNIA